MKASMYNVDPTGQFRYSYAANSNQLQLFAVEPDFNQLRAEIERYFAGETVSVEGIEEFVLTKTPFLDTHYKRQVLVPMERDGDIEITRSKRKRRFAYPDGTVIRFQSRSFCSEPSPPLAP